MVEAGPLYQLTRHEQPVDGHLTVHDTWKYYQASMINHEVRVNNCNNKQ